VKLKDIVGREFGEAVQQVMACPIPALASYNLAKVSKITTEQQKLFNSARESAVKRFADLRDDGSVKATEAGLVEFKSEADKDACIKEINELLDQEVEMPKVKLSSFGDAKIEPRALLALDHIIVE